MFLLPSRLRDMLKKGRPRILRGIFARNDRLVQAVKEMAISQRRAESDVYDDILDSGMQAIRLKQKHEAAWGHLSGREQQVAALICLGYRSYEIAGSLGISYETVRSHSKRIYSKFGLNRNQLRHALKHWNFEAWWEDHHG